MAYTKANQLTPTLRATIKSKVVAHIFKADYGQALKVAESFWEKHPFDFSICYLYSALLGDYAELCPPMEAKELKRGSIAMMRELLASSRAELPRRAQRHQERVLLADQEQDASVQARCCPRRFR